MQPQQTKNVVEDTEAFAKALAEADKLRRAIAELQRAYSKEEDVVEKQRLLVESAMLNRELAAHLKRHNLPATVQRKGRPMTEREVELHLPTQAMTPLQIAALSAAGMATPEGAAAMRDAAQAPREWPLICPWSVPALPKSPDVPGVAAMLASCKSYRCLQPVQRVEKDPNFKKGGGLKNFCTTKPTPQVIGQDSEWIALLQQMPMHNESRRAVYEALDEAVRTYYVGSGPLDGLLARVMAGDAIRRPQFQLFPHEREEVLARLPWDPERVPRLRELTLHQALGTIKINPSAGSGFPRHKKKGVVMAALLQDAAQYYELIETKQFNAYASKNPGEFLAELKNKHDRYEIADWGVKIRPYYNVNGGLAVLHSICMQNYAGALKGFWEDPNSCNAHGFSWNSGGAERLYDWVVWASKQKPGVYAIGYSDDGIWVLVGTDGKVWVSDRDIRQCDLSLGQSHRPMMVEHFRAVVGDKYGPGWVLVSQSAINGIWRLLVCMYGSIVVESVDKVHSGGVGTSEADQIGFATFVVCLRGAYDKALGTPIERFAQAEKDVEHRTGLKFKPSVWHPFEPKQETYPWTFLGKSLVRFRDTYLPYVSLAKCVAQLVTPKRNLPGQIGQCAWMERCRGLAVTSAFMHEELYAYMKATYERKFIAGQRPKPTLDGGETGEEDMDQILGTGVALTWPDEKFPTRAWVLNLYLPPRVKVGAEKAPVYAVKKTAAQMFDQLFPEQDQELWADRDQDVDEARSRVKDVLGDGQRIKPPELPLAAKPEAAYSLPALPQRVKDEYNAARRTAKALLKGGATGGRVRKGGKLETFLRGDFTERDVVFKRGGIEIQVREDAAEEAADYWGNEEDYVDDTTLDREYETREFEALERAYERTQRGGTKHSVWGN